MDSSGFWVPYSLCIGGLLVIVVLLVAYIICQRRDIRTINKAREKLVVDISNLSVEIDNLKTQLHLAKDNSNKLQAQLNLSLENCEELREQLNQALANSNRLRNQRNARKAELLEAHQNLQRREAALQAATIKIDNLEKEKAELEVKLASAPKQKLPMMEFTEADDQVLLKYINENMHLGGFRKIGSAFCDTDLYENILIAFGFPECENEFRRPTLDSVQSKVKRILQK